GGWGAIYHGPVVSGPFRSDISRGKWQFGKGSTTAAPEPGGGQRSPSPRPAKSFTSFVDTGTDQVRVRPPAAVLGPTCPVPVEIRTRRAASRAETYVPGGVPVFS